MPILAKKYTDKLCELKNNVEEWNAYFSENIKTYEKFTKFAVKSSLTDQDIATLQSIGKPTIEFNICDAFLSRLCGEFSKQQPSITVHAANGTPDNLMTPQLVETIQILEAHFRSLLADSSNNMLAYSTFLDIARGSYSVIEVYTDYVNERSFEQDICIVKAKDPTLYGFDPLAEQSHKGDGRYCFKLYPMTKEDFSARYGKKATDNMKFTRSLAGFSWSFKNEKEEVVLVCEYYEKQKKAETLIKLSDGQSLTDKEYKEFIKNWEECGDIRQPPIEIQRRKTVIETVCRYIFCESEVLEYEETNFKYLPFIFASGKSALIRESGTTSQMTIPYLYHAEGLQRLKNSAGQTLANELENMVQHKFVVPLESIPPDYLDAYQNVQKADTLVYHHFLQTKNGPNLETPLPPPREVVRTPIPPQISETFRSCDEMMQIILGSYDPSMSMNSAPISGVAFARSAIQSNSANMPYYIGYIQALNRVAECVLDLIPKYYRTPRSLPVLLPDGKRSFVSINKAGSLYMNYDSSSLQVKVESGVNFAMQKEIALQTIISLMSVSKGVAQFVDQYGLSILFDNIDIRGIEVWKEKAVEFQNKLNQQEKVSAQMQMMEFQKKQKMDQMSMMKVQKELSSPTPEQLGMMAIQEKSMIDKANLEIKQRDSDAKFLDVINKISNSNVENDLKSAEIDAENMRTAVETTVNLRKHMINELQGETGNEIT